MVTGASTAHLAIVLVDARHGVLEQTRRHAFLASLLGIPHIVLASTRWTWSTGTQERFEEIRDDFLEFAARLDVPRRHDHPDLGAATATTSSPVRAHARGTTGPPLLNHLEEVYIASDHNLIDARFPVQYVIRPQTPRAPRLPQLRGDGGQRRAAARRRGRRAADRQDVTHHRDRRPDGPVDEAFPPMAVVDAAWPTTSPSRAAT